MKVTGGEMNPLHAFTLNGVPCKSDLPPEVFSPDHLWQSSLQASSHLGYEFVPEALDAIAPGVYSVSALVERYDRRAGSVQLGWRKQAITVRAVEHGTAISTNSFGNPRNLDSLGEPSGYSLLALLGFELEDGNISAVPTPTTLQAAAERQGIAVRLFPRSGEISATDYLQTFADRCYPVATGQEGYYLHDTGNDHITAMLLGGQKLAAVLGAAAGRFLRNAHWDRDRAAGSMDEYTAHLRSVALGVGEFRGGNIAGMHTRHLRSVGSALGIPQPQTNEVIEAARDAAASFYAC